MRKIFILFAAVLFASSMMAVNKIEVWGDWDSWTKHELTSTDGNVTASFTVNLTEVKTYEFSIIVNENAYRVAKDPVTRTNNEVSGDGFGYNGNAELDADVAGDYTFTWTFAEEKLTVTYPIVTISSMTFEATFPKPGEIAGDHVDLVEPKNAPYWMCGYDVMNAAKSANVNHLEVTENTDYNIYVSLCKKPGYVFAVDAAISVDGTLVASEDKIKNTADEQEFWLPFNSGSATALDETATDASAVKRLHNGQLFIERDGKTFNAQGVEVK